MYYKKSRTNRNLSVFNPSLGSRNEFCSHDNIPFCFVRFSLLIPRLITVSQFGFSLESLMSEQVCGALLGKTVSFCSPIECRYV
jgi:hypothetical protein